MHPILASRRFLALYLMAWLPVVAVLSAAMVLTGWETWAQSLVFSFAMTVVYAFLCLAAWYPCRAIPLDDHNVVTALFTHFTAAVASAMLWVGLAWVLSSGFGQSSIYRGTSDLSPEQVGVVFVTGLLLYLLSVSSHYLFVAADASREAKRRALEAEVTARDAELQALKAQLNPHYLFNSLNSVASLTATDPDGARDMCVQLGDYLRGTLKGGSDLQPLSEELAQIRRFLRVESVRYGDRLRVVEDVDHGCLDVAVPPLLLQPLIENALKHGIAELVEGGKIRIAASCTGSRMTVRVENPVDPDCASAGGAGVGLVNVRSRLENVYGDEATIRSSRARDSYIAEIAVPIVRTESRTEDAIDG